jgi:hypothetical protein
MSKRTLLFMVVALVLILGGGALYYWTVARPAAAAADCADKPKPKDEFAMAAACEGGETPGKGESAPKDAKPSTPR